MTWITKKAVTTRKEVTADWSCRNFSRLILHQHNHRNTIATFSSKFEICKFRDCCLTRYKICISILDNFSQISPFLYILSLIARCSFFQDVSTSFSLLFFSSPNHSLIYLIILASMVFARYHGYAMQRPAIAV